MKKQSGFTLIELIIFVVMVVFIGGGVIYNMIANNRGATEKRATELMENYIETHQISNVTRKSCAGDSSAAKKGGDGYASCIIVTADEKIALKCPSNFMDVNLFGATTCKEVFMPVGMYHQGPAQ